MTAGTTERSAPGSPLRQDLTDPRWRLVLATVAVLAALLVGGAAITARQVSILDEWTHADYAWQLMHGQIPSRGSAVAPEILAEFSCRGASNGVGLPPCGSSGPPEAYPFRGENYNFAHPPLYYAITGLLATGTDLVVPGDNFMTLARLTGVLWLWLGMALLYTAVRVFGGSRAHALIAAALLPLAPAVLSATSVITNDAPAVACGAAALLLGARAIRGNAVSWWLAGLLALAATMTKVLNGLPFVVLAGMLLVMAVARWRRSDRQGALAAFTPALAIGAAVLVVYVGWAAFQAGRGDPNWTSPVSSVHAEDVIGLPISEWAGTFFAGLSLQYPYILTPELDNSAVGIWAAGLDAALFVAAPMAIVAVRRGRSLWALGLASLGGLLAWPTIVQVQIFLHSRHYFPSLAPRYGMTLLPWATACLLLVAAARKSIWIPSLMVCVGALVMTSMLIVAL